MPSRIVRRGSRAGIEAEEAYPLERRSDAAVTNSLSKSPAEILGMR
jgi:hypothetical protein